MFGIFDLLDNILPSVDRSNHDTLRLEYLSACKIMENDNCIINWLPHIPASMFEPLVKSAIYNCYLDFVNNDKTSIVNIDKFIAYMYEKEIAFPKTLCTLILNWPHSELVLRTKIPTLYPPVDIFKSRHGPLSICEVGNMQIVFGKFCNRLMQLIIPAVLKCSPSNTCKLRRLDLSGLGYFYDTNIPWVYQGLPKLEEILEGIQNSTIDTFGHKIDIFMDAKIRYLREGFECLKQISEESCNPNLGIAVHFKNLDLTASSVKLPTDFYKVLALGGADNIQLRGFEFIDKSFVENLCTQLPELAGIGLIPIQANNESLDWFSAFENIEQLSLHCNKIKGLLDRYQPTSSSYLFNSVCNMSKGLKYLDLRNCNLYKDDLECLANSIHSNTLLELNLSGNAIRNDSESVGLIMLCHKLNNVKVITLDNCALHTLSSQSVSDLVNGFTDCVKLEFLSMNINSFSLEITNIIIDGLAHNISLRYLSLELPGGQYDSCKTFHETINKYRSSPIYISWRL